MKLCQGKFRWDIGERLFLQGLVGPWNRFPRDMVMAGPARAQGAPGPCS